jgi:hypothetical protein
MSGSSILVTLNALRARLSMRVEPASDSVPEPSSAKPGDPAGQQVGALATSAAFSGYPAFAGHDNAGPDAFAAGHSASVESAP